MPWEDGKIRYVGKGTVTLAEGREVPVVAALVLKLDPEKVPGFTYDRHTTWVGSIHTDTDDDLWDASPGLLTLPDGRAGTFMTTSGPPDLVGISGIGPAPFGPLRDADAHWEHPNSPPTMPLPQTSTRWMTRSRPPRSGNGPDDRG
ncbi:hypothetical protein ACFU5O_36520 [Streptomyces sp. NPDC057445]|uniref:hypothetical protein n=1 Tax=Streptomyces sp. NPDC057445 TaxID=3346136 RepID=UPI0036AE3F36